jgi:hypothetical protein
MTMTRHTLSHHVAVQGASVRHPVAQPRSGRSERARPAGQDQAAMIEWLFECIVHLELAVMRLESMLAKQNSTGAVTLYGTSSVDIHANGDMQIDAGGKIALCAGSIQLGAGSVVASGLLKCDMLVANHVQSSSYAPGAGNTW